MTVPDTLRLAAASAADLAILAPQLASDTLFTTYEVGAEALRTRWTYALGQPGQSLLVAHRGNAPVGLCWFFTTGTFGNGGYLRLVAVVPGGQGKQVGAALLTAYEDGCGRPGGGWFLLCADWNVAAQRFYMRHGYQHVGQLPGFVKPQFAEYIFWKPAKAAP